MILLGILTYGLLAALAIAIIAIVTSTVRLIVNDIRNGY